MVTSFMNEIFCSFGIVTAFFTVLMFVSSPVGAEGEDTLEELVQLISYEAEEPELDIAQATVSNCTLTLETLRRSPDRTIISTNTIVPLQSLHGNNSWFNITPGREEDGASWHIRISDETSSASYRLDQPSRIARLNFQDRFGQRCSGDLCQIDFKPSVLSLRIQTSTPDQRANLVGIFHAGIDYCYNRID